MELRAYKVAVPLKALFQKMVKKWFWTCEKGILKKWSKNGQGPFWTMTIV